MKQKRDRLVKCESAMEARHDEAKLARHIPAECYEVQPGCELRHNDRLAWPDCGSEFADLATTKWSG